MNKILSSRIFVIIMPILVLSIGIIAGWLLSYQPNVTGRVSGSVGYTSGSTATAYVFQIKTAIGYWLFALIISLVVLLICVLIRKQYTNYKSLENSNN